MLITRVGNRGRQAKYCSRSCGRAYNAEQTRLKHLELNPDYVRDCENCGQTFSSRKKDQRYCTNDCRLALAPGKASMRWRAAHPEQGPVEYECSICAVKITKAKKISGVAIKYGVYCDTCRLAAQRARYRKKTVARQSKTVKPSGLWIEEIIATWGSDCFVCKEPVDMTLPRTSKQGATVEHIIPLSKDGTDEIDNLRISHWACNNKKSNKLGEELNG